MADVSAITALGQVPQTDFAKNASGAIGLVNDVTRNRLLNQQVQNAQLENQTGQQQLSQRMNQDFAQKLFAVNQLDDQEVVPWAHDLLTHALQTGSLTPDRAGMYRSVIESGDVKRIRTLANLGVVGTMSGPDAVHTVLGIPASMDNGQQTVFGTTGGMLSRSPGSFTPSGAPQQKYTSPEFNSGLQTVYNPDGTITYRRNTEVPGVAPIPQPPGKPIPGSGGYPNQNQPAPAPNQGGGGSQPPAQQPGTGGGGASTTTTPPPAQPSTGGAGAGPYPGVKESVDAYNTDLRDVPNGNQRVRDLLTANTALKIASSGPASDWYQQVNAFLGSLGVTPPSWQNNANGYYEARKYLLRYAAGLPGVKSNEGLSTNIESQANTDIPNPVARTVTQANIAQERMKMAQVLQAQKDGGDNYTGHDYNKRAATFNNQYDRRGFAYDLYDDAKKKSLEKELGDPNDPHNPNRAASQKFWRSVGKAHELGLIQ